MAKNGKCKAGYYYCYTDKKCKPIPKGFKAVGPAGMLRKEPGHSEEEGETKKNGNGNGNGHGNGNGSNGGGGNGNGGAGGGMGEEVVYEGGNVSEEGLRDWFGKSRSKGGKPGWVQVVSGKPCARQPGQKSTPKCVSSAKRASMSKSERESAQRRKRAADPGQPQKTGAAKPTYVSTDKPKMKSVKESAEFVTLPLNIEIPNNIRDFNLGLMFRESLEENSGMLFIFDEVAEQSFHMSETRIPLDIAFIKEDGTIESIKQLEPLEETPVSSDGEVLCALEVNRGWFEENDVEVGDQIDIEEGKKDACYHKVKSRYSVWPSAYASGALVKCRKVGAANWGNKTKKEEFEIDEMHDTPKNVKGIAKELDKAVEMHKSQAKRLRKAGISEDNLDEKCWKGYKKKGMKTMFGKRYPNCVKEEEVEQIDEKKGCVHTHEGEECPVHGKKSCPDLVKEAQRIPQRTGNIVKVILTFRGKMYSIQMFFPTVKLPSRADVQTEIEKVYPGGKVRSYDVSDYTPGQPLLYTEAAAWTKKEGKNKSGGLNEKGRKSYERENPGSNLKAPSKKVGNPRRKSFCARMRGMKKKLTSAKTARDPDSRINKSLRAWNC